MLIFREAVFGAQAQQLKDHLATVLKELQHILRALPVTGAAW